MIPLIALAVGVVYAVALLLVLRGSLWQLLLGLALLSHGAHLLIFSGSGLVLGIPPLTPDDKLAPMAGSADPLSQALILTAIVIAFAVLAFILVLALCAGEAVETDDLDHYSGEGG